MDVTSQRRGDTPDPATDLARSGHVQDTGSVPGPADGQRTPEDVLALAIQLGGHLPSGQAGPAR